MRSRSYPRAGPSFDPPPCHATIRRRISTASAGVRARAWGPTAAGCRRRRGVVRRTVGDGSLAGLGQHGAGVASGTDRGAGAQVPVDALRSELAQPDRPQRRDQYLVDHPLIAV